MRTICDLLCFRVFVLVQTAFTHVYQGYFTGLEQRYDIWVALKALWIIWVNELIYEQPIIKQQWNQVQSNHVHIWWVYESGGDN